MSHGDEACYADALVLVATGEEREAARGILLDKYPERTPEQIADEMADALRDALRQGIDKDDVDPSWL